MELLALALAVLFSITRGVDEGMTMIKPMDAGHLNEFGDPMGKHEFGIRGHRWFRWYHTIGVIEFTSLGLLCYLIPLWFSWLMLACVLLILWEFIELAYSFTRNKVLIADYEHIVLFRNVGIYLEYPQNFYLHAGRLCVILCTMLTIFFS